MASIRSDFGRTASVFSGRNYLLNYDDLCYGDLVLCEGDGKSKNSLAIKAFQLANFPKRPDICCWTHVAMYVGDGFIIESVPADAPIEPEDRPESSEGSPGSGVGGGDTTSSEPQDADAGPTPEPATGVVVAPLAKYEMASHLQIRRCTSEKWRKDNGRYRVARHALLDHALVRRGYNRRRIITGSLGLPFDGMLETSYICSELILMYYAIGSELLTAEYEALAAGTFFFPAKFAAHRHFEPVDIGWHRLTS